MLKTVVKHKKMISKFSPLNTWTHGSIDWSERFDIRAYCTKYKAEVTSVREAQELCDHLIIFTDDKSVLEARRNSKQSSLKQTSDMSFKDSHYWHNWERE